MKRDADISYIHFHHISAKFPDVLPLGYFAFSLLKKAISKRRLPPQLIDYGKFRKRNGKQYFRKFYKNPFYYGKDDVDL